MYKKNLNLPILFVEKITVHYVLCLLFKQYGLNKVIPGIHYEE